MLIVKTPIRRLRQIIRDHDKEVEFLRLEGEISRSKERKLHIWASILLGCLAGFCLTMGVATGINPRFEPVSAFIVCLGFCFIIQTTTQRICGNRIGEVVFKMFFACCYGASLATFLGIVTGKFGF